jgi:hypothetical protein
MNGRSHAGSLWSWLICRAARRAPPDLAARLEEEGLATRSGPGARGALAVGCVWASHVIPREQALPKLAPVSSGGPRLENGRTVSACYPFRIRFRLRD